VSSRRGRLPDERAPRSDRRDIIDAVPQLFHLELELQEAAEDELELPTIPTLAPRHHGPGVHGQETGVPPVPDLPREIFGPDLATVRQHDHALDEVPQLAHVPRPWVLHQ